MHIIYFTMKLYSLYCIDIYIYIYICVCMCVTEC